MSLMESTFVEFYHGGTGTLVSWLECEITDHGCLNLLPNWKDSAFIFQKNSTFLTCPACQLMMLFMQCFFVCRFFVMLCILCCSKYQIKKLIYTLVNILLADLFRSLRLQSALLLRQDLG